MAAARSSKEAAAAPHPAQGPAQLLRLLGPARRQGGIALQGELTQIAQDAVEEEADPDALAAALAADEVEAVVPVAGAHQRDAVPATSRQRQLVGAAGMLPDRGGLA